MNKEFIPYNQALALKELGFDEPCFGSYVKLTETQNTFFMNDVVSEIDRETPLHKSLITKAPLYQQAFRWFREKYDIPFAIHCDTDWRLGYIRGYYPVIATSSKQRTEPIWKNGDCFDTPEEAELACLKKLIEICKNK